MLCLAAAMKPLGPGRSILCRWSNQLAPTPPQPISDTPLARSLSISLSTSLSLSYHTKVVQSTGSLSTSRISGIYLTFASTLAYPSARFSTYRTFSSSTRLMDATGRKKSFYDVLDLPRSSDKKEIKRKFYELSMKYHPDKNQEDESAHIRFLEISEAYSVLGNDVKRRDYDLDHDTSTTFGDSARNSRTGPGHAAYGHSPYTRHPLKSKLRPDDYIQYRAPGSGPGGTYAGFNGPKSAGQHRPAFDFYTHQESHYGPAEKARHNRTRKAAMYRSIFHTNMTEPRVWPFLVLMLFCFAFYNSGFIGMIWMENNVGFSVNCIGMDVVVLPAGVHTYSDPLIPLEIA
ncbi:hypothetical protein BASA50_009911 [Batrachochytrium salamandrivorans]|uniref:J domain-containing protein n=1 Tax=Batrachochytrium salamandrivorans TaxID=1357716 RepID=A0ABQ8F2U8_9FUNG|nr:hypothetical protein BASA60_005602 [Batrachochytrium salamandrivorans]KAH6589599.1 hypothetical protein BASA50_009911 [Batrachochytrium salamandrivorans]